MCVCVCVCVCVYVCVLSVDAYVCLKSTMRMLARIMTQALMFADLTQSDTRAGWAATRSLTKRILHFMCQLALLSILFLVLTCKLLPSDTRFLCFCTLALLRSIAVFVD